MPTLRAVTLGCRVNQYETEFFRQGLAQGGFVDAAPDEAADLCVVNTCTVTGEADSKGRQLIRQLHQQNPQAKIIVMGCYAARAREELAALPGVAEVLSDKRELPDLLGRFGVVDLPQGIHEFGQHTRAWVKVQDGCLLRCTYCIIPLVRPHFNSRPADQIVAEVRRLVAGGHREMVLTGIHLGHYGVEWSRGRPKRDWFRLADLVARLADLDGNFRIRLSSIEATEVTQELLAVMRRHPQRVCPHLHICLQSGSDRVLRRMGRRWCSRRIIDRCQMVREALDLPALTTDVLVGFPGETTDDFEATCRVVETIGFSKLHVFPFSRRPGTAAADLPHQVPEPVKRQRVRALQELEGILRQRYWAQLSGRTLQVLFEAPPTQRPGWGVGTACRYQTVWVPGAAQRRGELHSIAVTSTPDGLIGRDVSHSL